MMRVVRWGVGIAAGVAAVALLVWVVRLAWDASRPLPEVLQGQVEATQATVSAKLAGRVERLDVAEGHRVRKGQVVGALSVPEIDARLAQADAATEAARAQADRADAGARQEEIRQAEAMWRRARAATDLAEKTWARVERLHADGVVPAQRRDEAQANLQASRDAEAAAKAAYDMAVEGARSEDKRAARAGVARAKAATSEIAAFAAERLLAAPIGGEVARRVAEPGELVGAGAPILTIVDLDDAWVVFQVREDRLDGVQPGHRFAARVPALSGRVVELEITYVAALADFATTRPTNLQGGFDLRTFEVRARPVSPVPALRPGMSVLVDGGRLTTAAGDGTGRR